MECLLLASGWEDMIFSNCSSCRVLWISFNEQQNNPVTLIPYSFFLHTSYISIFYFHTKVEII